MIRLKITMNSGAFVTRDCHNQQEADEYLSYIAINNNWGKREYQKEINPATFDEENNLIQEAIYETIPAEYTIIQTDITSELAEQARKDALKAAGAKARIACQTVLDLISGHNLSSELTAAQITTMTQTFGPLVQALSISRPSTAKLLIQAITPDSTLITEQMKQDCLDELNDY